MAQHRAIQRLLDVGVRTLGAVPYSLGPRGSALLGSAGYRLYGSERRLALWNLQHCYPCRPESWRQHTAVAFFEHLVTSAYEVFHAVQNPDEMDGLIAVEHAERLDAALARGRGVIGVTGHYGNFALLPFALRSVSPEPAFIARASKRKVGPLVSAARSYYREFLKPLAGMQVLSSSLSGARDAARLLHQGNLVIVFADLTWGMGEMPAEFLGVPHRVSRAPASLALRTGAVLLPIITRRLEDGSHRVTIEAPIAPPEESTQHQIAERLMMEQFTTLFEAYVQRRPEQWYWLHRSWRPAYPSILR